jgi:hypothetical protein
VTPGMPGAGIGGIFYLLSAFFMPFAELYRTIRGRSSRARWLGVLRQLTLAVSIVGSVWAMGWLLAWLLSAGAGEVASETSASGEVARVTNFLGVGPLVAALLALALVIGLVEAAVLVRRRVRSLAG